LAVNLSVDKIFLIIIDGFDLLIKFISKLIVNLFVCKIYQ